MTAPTAPTAPTVLTVPRRGVPRQCQCGRRGGRTRDAFDHFDITTTRTTEERGGDVRQFEGKTGDLDVTVKLERKSPSTTNVEVTARKNAAEWDKDFAQKVLAEIVGD